MGIAGAVRSRAADVPTNGSATLGSWKEIAAYLGKDVRTVQRWEEELSLPIRRPIEHNTRIVIAVPAELDAWIQRQSTKNSHGSQFAPRGDGIFRARLARLTETLQQLTAPCAICNSPPTNSLRSSVADVNCLPRYAKLGR